jgi:hypothetical protein
VVSAGPGERRAVRRRFGLAYRAEVLVECVQVRELVEDAHDEQGEVDRDCCNAGGHRQPAAGGQLRRWPQASRKVWVLLAELSLDRGE